MGSVGIRGSISLAKKSPPPSKHAVLICLWTPRGTHLSCVARRRRKTLSSVPSR
ncbi:hypothetical protein CJ030_MR8G001939 [Morella rubra]|uniref:Uncharacterized protein n=1 Tax=Morella rubra TaxID=262757 RepID=A0A6A1UU74_9ROSI|nr:hypothetical protein CJ030_MR8G001939 [Morella rubra]